MEAVTEVCGFSKSHQTRRVTWWWNDHVETAIAEKRAYFKAYNAMRAQGNSIEAVAAKTSCTAAKQAAKHEVWLEKYEAEAEVFENLEPYASDIYRLARQMDSANQDIVGEKCVRNDAGELALSDAEKMKAWVEHYSKLLNVEFDWPRELLPSVASTQGPVLPITT
ncbi:MAG: hypothetical protein GY702_25195, partial [Desulfobulbaceae bacterium]|nr:hypothetical protein [Desulfobulbaceae bacterium]